MNQRRIALWSLRILCAGLVIAAALMTAAYLPAMIGSAECGDREIGADPVSAIGCAAEAMAWVAFVCTWLGVAPVVLAGIATVVHDARIQAAALVGLLLGLFGTVVAALVDFDRWEQLLPPAAFATLIVLLREALRRDGKPAPPCREPPAARS